MPAHLVPVPAVAQGPAHWLIFFATGRRPWRWFMRRGFSHVMCAGYDAGAGLWVFYNPQSEATMIAVRRPGEEVDTMLGLWRERSSVVLRVAQSYERRLSPPMLCCTASVKALIGVRCMALTPHQLMRHLVRRGAEVVDLPQAENGVVGLGEHLRRRRRARAGGGQPALAAVPPASGGRGGPSAA